MNALERYVGTFVILKVDVPADKRGEVIPSGTRLVVTKLVGEQHFDLEFPGGRRAASQVHFSKLKTG